MSNLFDELKRRNVVRVGAAYLIVAWLLAQIADLGLENFGAPEWVIKTILFLLVLGFPLALFFAWAFELTPEGLKLEKDVDRSKSVTPLTGRKLDFLIIGALVVALGYFVWERQNLGDDVDSASEPVAADVGDASAGARTRRSIAVLPFVNMSSDPEQEWFADGLTEELLNALARAPDLLVAARTSSFKFKGTTEDIPTIAKALGVAHILEGSVRRGRDRLRVTAQLIRANDGFHLWSQTYDRKPDDVIAIQEEVAIEIARALDTAMDPKALAKMASAGTASVPAYEAYLEALAYGARTLQTGDSQLLLKQRSALERAQALDPDFAAAYWEMAQFWQGQMQVTSIGSELTSDTAEERKAKYKIAIDKAIASETDPVIQTLYRAHEASVELRINEALNLITRYLSDRPNDYSAIDSQLTLLMFLRRWEDAHPVAHHLADIAGEDSVSMQSAVQDLVFANDASGAVRVARRAIKNHPGNALVEYQAHRAFLWGGKLDEAREVLRSMESSQLEWFNKDLAKMRQACAEGDTEQALRIHEKFVNEYTEGQALLWISYNLLGLSEQATAELMPYDESKQMYALSGYLVYPFFDPRPFPNLMKWVTQEGIENLSPIEIPYRCNLPAGSAT
jgi:TolB-like protein